MIAVDTNVLVHAHRRDSRFHTAASAAVATLAESGERWAIPWPCVHEFVGVVTHPRVYSPPTTRDEAIGQVETWRASPTLVLLAESDGYWATLTGHLRDGNVVGAKVHDARIAALCRLHGVVELWSADRDFSRFPALRVRNPLVAR